MGNEPLTLERFVTDYLESREALVEAVEPGVVQVLGSRGAGWPAESEMAKIVFDPEALADHPDGVPVFFGTPRADEILDRGRALAPVARAHRAGVPVTLHDLTSRVHRTLHAPEFIWEQVGGARARYDARALFHFRVAYLGEEREEEIFTAGVDVVLGRPARGLDGWLEGEILVSDRPHPFPDGPMMPMEDALALAWREVLPRVLSGRRVRVEECRKRLGVEKERLVEYFGEALRDVERRSADAADAERTEWESRKRATLAERNRRLAELTVKEEVRVQASLAALLLIWSPRVVSSFRLRRKETTSVPIEVLYDLAEEAVLPPDCPECRRPTLEWRLGPRGVGGSLPPVLCPGCAERAAEALARRR